MPCYLYPCKPCSLRKSIKFFCNLMLFIIFLCSSSPVRIPCRCARPISSFCLSSYSSFNFLLLLLLLILSPCPPYPPHPPPYIPHLPPSPLRATQTETTPRVALVVSRRFFLGLSKGLCPPLLMVCTRMGGGGGGEGRGCKMQWIGLGCACAVCGDGRMGVLLCVRVF